MFSYSAIAPATNSVSCNGKCGREQRDLLKSIPDYNKSGSITEQELAYCNALFDLEKKFAELSFDERYEARKVHSAPIMDEFFDWTESSTGHILASPRSAIGKAVRYALGQRKYLENVLLDGRLELSNNRAERSIKPFVIGRKNWLFSNTGKGAIASSVIYSIVETAKENGLKPYEYLKYIFETAPNIDITEPEQLEKLLPWNAPEECRSDVNP